MSSLEKFMVLRRILLLNDGRDKVLKVIQYTAKFLLWSYLKDGSWLEKSKKWAAQLSISRKIIRLFHWLEPIQDSIDLSKQGMQLSGLSGPERRVKLLAPLMALNSICNDLSDDLICLSKIGVIDKKWIDRCTPLSDRLWFFGIFMDLYENRVVHHSLQKKLKSETDPSKANALQSKLGMQQISFLKLCCDFILCFIDVFLLGDRVSDGYQASAGLLAALFGTYKIYVKVQ